MRLAWTAAATLALVAASTTGLLLGRAADVGDGSAGGLHLAAGERPRVALEAIGRLDVVAPLPAPSAGRKPTTSAPSNTSSASHHATTQPVPAPSGTTTSTQQPAPRSSATTNAEKADDGGELLQTTPP